VCDCFQHPAVASTQAINKREMKRSQDDRYANGEEQKTEECFDDESAPSTQHSNIEGAPRSAKAGTEAAPGKKAAPKKKPEINPDFKDVEETGKWGAISKTEIYIAAIFSVAVVIGVVVALVIVLTGSKDSPAAATTPPTAAPTYGTLVATTPKQQLDAIRAATSANAFLTDSLALLPEDDTFYVGKYSDTSQPAQVRAASWIMYGDDRKEAHTSTWLMPRYALVVFYYSTGGEAWFTQTNWLTAGHSCTWFGVTCDRFSVYVEELDLSANNAVGPLPSEIMFLTEMKALTLSNNGISGTLPAAQLGNTPMLTLLYLDNNQLTGPVSADLIEGNGLRKYMLCKQIVSRIVLPVNISLTLFITLLSIITETLFLQENLLTGTFPIDFCARPGKPPIFNDFGIDCEELTCFCCNTDGSGSNPCY
jgi:hypothetical protein